MFMRTSTHDRRMSQAKDRFDTMYNKYIDRTNSLAASEIFCIHLKATLDAHEKNTIDKTKYWQDKSGRWRDPKTGHCVKTSVVMEAQLRKEANDKYRAQQQSQRAAQAQSRNGGV